MKKNKELVVCDHAHKNCPEGCEHRVRHEKDLLRPCDPAPCEWQNKKGVVLKFIARCIVSKRLKKSK